MLENTLKGIVLDTVSHWIFPHALSITAGMENALAVTTM